MYFLQIILLALSSFLAFAFSPEGSLSVFATRHQHSANAGQVFMSTVEAPTRERTDTDRNTRRKGNEKTLDDDSFYTGEDDSDYPDLEYLQDDSVAREMDDPFHILLLGSTFEKPKVTLTYVAGSLEYVLSMPHEEGKELAKFAKEEGMSCLGTWPREECLNLGRQLQMRDLVCRVVPFCEGGQRGWQAKDASNNEYSNSDNFS